MIRRPPRSTRTDTLFPYTTLFRSLRSFPGLVNREEDYHEEILNKFINYCRVPVVSMESATLHPLQSFADLITIEENKTRKHTKVVLAWAPHVRSLPPAVRSDERRVGKECVSTC